MEATSGARIDVKDKRTRLFKPQLYMIYGTTAEIIRPDVMRVHGTESFSGYVPSIPHPAREAGYPFPVQAGPHASGSYPAALVHRAPGMRTASIASTIGLGRNIEDCLIENNGGDGMAINGDIR